MAQEDSISIGLGTSLIRNPGRIICLNILRPSQNFADDIFKCIFLNWNIWILIKISLMFVLKGPINNMPSLVQVMAWRRPGDKPLSEPMMVRLSIHISVTRPQWINPSFIYTSVWWHTICSMHTCTSRDNGLEIHIWGYEIKSCALLCSGFSVIYWLTISIGWDTGLTWNRHQANLS